MNFTVRCAIVKRESREKMNIVDANPEVFLNSEAVDTFV